jgi:hypothetical protein
MTTGELIEALGRVPADTVVGLQVYGHGYDSRNDRRSHGPMVVWLDHRGHVVLSDDCGGNKRENLDGKTLHADR